MSNNISKRWIGLILSIFCTINLFGQTDNLDTTIYFDSQVRMNIGVNLHSPLRIEQIEGTPILASIPMPIYDIGIEHYKHVHSNWGFEIGLHYSRIPYLIKYFIEVPPSNILYDQHLGIKSADYFVQYVAIPIAINKLFFTPNRTFSVSGGVKLNYIAPFQISFIDQYIVDSNTVTLFEFTLANTSEKWIASYFSKIGLLSLTKKNNSIHYYMIMNISSIKVGTGAFNFNQLPSSNSGKVQLGISYIGFGIEYGYSLSKRLKN